MWWPKWGRLRSSAPGDWLRWLERCLHTAEVTGSSPVSPTRNAPRQRPAHRSSSVATVGSTHFHRAGAEPLLSSDFDCWSPGSNERATDLNDEHLTYRVGIGRRIPRASLPKRRNRSFFRFAHSVCSALLLMLKRSTSPFRHRQWGLINTCVPRSVQAWRLALHDSEPIMQQSPRFVSK
jgi:hypothetical protein